MRTLKYIPQFLGLLALLLAGCSVVNNDADTIAICSSLPTAGGTNSQAMSMQRGIEMAFQEANHSLTVGGKTYTIKYVPMDDTQGQNTGWSAQQEQENARAAISEHNCVAYIGTYNSGAAKAAIPILNRVQMPMISPGNTSPGLTKPGLGIGGEPWVYSPLGPAARNYCRVVPTDEIQVPPAADYAQDALGVQRVYILHDTEIYGEGLATLFAARAREIGLEVVGGPEGNAAVLVDDYTPLAQKILQTSPDLVYFGGVTDNEPALLFAALRNLGYNGVFMGADGIAGQDFVSQAGTIPENMVYATLVVMPPSQLQGRGVAWVNQYQQRYGESPDPFAVPSYEAALVVLDAIQRAQSIDRAQILQAMKATQNFDKGLLRPWSFDANCDTTDTTITMNQVRDGRFEFVADVSPTSP